MQRKISIVTLYNPDLKCFENVELLLKQSDLVILCDNSIKNNKILLPKNNKIIYFWFNKNLGLSGAFNYALKSKKIQWREDDFIFFFDQDSSIPENHVELLTEEYINLKKSGIKVGCMGPVYYNLNTNRIMMPRKKEWINSVSFKTKNIITSSMLCVYGDLKNINFWNEDIFLDMADWDLCWRFQNYGLECIETKVSFLYHSLGNGEKKVGLMRIRYDSPIREYYQTRDSLYLSNKKYVPFKMKLRLFYIHKLRNIIHIMFLENKKERYIYIKRARRDYKDNIHGEFIN